MPVGRFLCGIGALIRDPETERYLILRRAATKDVGAGHWECPTGRVDQGESFQEALVREVKEELGVIINPEFILGTTHFYRGADRPENELNGLIYACRLSENESIRMGKEHDAMHWLSGQEIHSFLPKSHWLHWCIRRDQQLRQGTSAQLREIFLREGFEMGGLDS
jgi:8-oxo-dGTP diphosphatase